MDTSSLIIGLVLTLVCALPIIYIAKAQGKTKNKIKEIFSRYHQGKFIFTTKETHFKKIFALDEQNKGFLFVNLDADHDDTHFVDLNDVTSCRIEQVNIGSNSKIIMHFKSGTKENKEVVLYDLESDKLGNVYWPGNEQIAKKWQKLIEDCF